MARPSSTALPPALFLLAAAAAGPLTAQEEPILGAPSGFDAAAFEEERIPAAADRRLYAEPDLRAAVVGVVEAATELPVLERRGPWVRVRHGTVKGWLLTDREGAEAPRLLGPTAMPADPERVERARRILAAGADGEPRPRKLGPFELWTDAEDGRLLQDLSEIAAGVEEAYRQRFGLTPLPAAAEAVALFSREAGYRDFTRPERGIAELAAWGHSGAGIAALSLEGRSDGEVRRLLIHELAHLVSRRALGGDLPAWLEEGMAEDLAMSRVSRSGRILPRTLAGRATASPEMLDSDPTDRSLRGVIRSGPQAALRQLLAGWDSAARPSLAALVDMPAAELADPQRRDLLYPLSAFFVRYLLDGDGGARAAAFREHLAEIPRGGPVDSEALRQRLGATWEELDEGLRRWLRLQAASGP